MAAVGNMLRSTSGVSALAAEDVMRRPLNRTSVREAERLRRFTELTPSVRPAVNWLASPNTAPLDGSDLIRSTIEGEPRFFRSSELSTVTGRAVCSAAPVM